MRFSLFAMIRLMAIVAAASGLVAVGVARMEPRVSHFRVGMPPHYSVINGFSINRWEGRLEFLDAETGEFVKISMPSEDRLEFGSCSPWQDDEGESQVVGRWIHEVGQGNDKHCEGVGIARYSLPSGRVLDRIPLEVMATSHPCWFPGLSTKVLFSGSDGRLYTMTFADRPDVDEAPIPRAVSWRCPPPGKQVALKDPVWPPDPRFGGRLIVSLSQQAREEGARYTASRLWWLLLNSDGTAIVDAGPLPVPDRQEVADEDVEERFPNLAVTPEGDFALTYLWQRQGREHWQLRFSRVSATETTAPMILPGTTRTVTDKHIPALAPFSADGRWVFSLVEKTKRKLEMVRVPTASSLADED